MDILEKEISIGYAREGARAYKWPTLTSTVKVFIDFLSEHKEGEKDGFSILQGTVLPSGQRKVSDRKATAVDQLSLVILDIDTGDSIDRIEAICRKLGLFAIIHTTFSHNSTKTKIKKDKILSWLADGDQEPTKAEVVKYLATEKRLDPSILATVQLQGTIQDNDGIQLLVSHAPMPKLRVIFVLDKPFVIADRGGSQKKAIEEWKQRYVGVARMIGATADRACVDPSRLMYTPRHPPGRDDYDFRVIEGNPLDIESVERVDLKGQEVTNQWLEQGESERKEYKTEGILRFVAKHSDHFDVADMCRNSFEVRRDDGQKVTVPCPNDDAHTDAGNSEDMGFFAGTNDESGGFVLKCMHDSCAQFDRVDFLDMMCQELGWTVKDLAPYVAKIVGEEDIPADADDPFANISDVLKWLNDKSTEIDKERLDAFLEIVAKFQPDPLQLDEIATLVYQKTKGAKASVIKRVIADKQKGVNDTDDEDYSNLPEAVIERLKKECDKYSVVLVKNDPCVLKRNNKKIGLINEPYEMLTFDAYKQIRINDNMTIKKDDYNIAKCFLNWGGRKTYEDGLIFEPPPQRAHGNVFNHWDGFQHIPVEGDWSIISDHVLNIICQGNEDYYEYLMTWLAHLFQRPGEKIGAAIVVRGKKGTGKSIFFDKFMNHLLRQYAMTISNSNQIVGQFNAHLFGKLYICLEEAVWAGDSKGEGILKSLISDETMTYEFKGMTPFMGSNYTRIAFLSNEDWVVPATEDERRYFILNPADTYRENKEYFITLANAINDPSVQSAFMHDMLYTPVDDWNLLRFPPRTTWLKEQISISANPEDRFFIEMIQAAGTRAEATAANGGLDEIYLNEETPSEVDASLLYLHYKFSLNNAGVGVIRRARSFSVFEQKMRKFFGVNIEKRRFADTRIETAIIPPLNVVRERLRKEGFAV